MAKYVSELGADVFDDTVVVKQTRFTSKQRNYMIGLPILALLIGALVTVFVMAANVWLIDFENMPYIRYTIDSEPDENGEITASINKVANTDNNYPSTFRIPGYINGYKITRIDANAFDGCDRLQKVIMTDNIVSIGEYAFAGCTSLEEFVFSKNINHIGTGAFEYTPYLENLPDNETILINSVLLNVGDNVLDDNTALVTLDGDYKTRFTNYIEAGYNLFSIDSLQRITDINNIPESNLQITQWMDGVFEGNEKVEIVEIPKDFTEIPSNSFVNCPNLEEIVFHNNVTHIGESAFRDCQNLTELDIPDNVTHIGNYAFENCGVTIDTIPNTIQELGEGVFKGCEEITSFKYPSTLSTVPNETFSGCTSLANFTFDNPDSILDLGASAFKGTAITTFTIPNNIIRIPQSCFENCTNLKTVFMLENVNKTEIPSENEADATLQGVQTVTALAFSGCTQLSSIKLIDNEGNVLSKCINPNTFYLPSTLTNLSSINVGSTHKGFAQTAVKNVVLTKNTASIGVETFLNCKLLESITFEEISNSALQIVGAKAFQNCTSLTSFTFPDRVNDIASGVFQNCTSLSRVHLPEYNDIIFGQDETKPTKKYTVIKENLFEGCTSLEEVNIPSTVSKLSTFTFKNCTSLRSLYIPKNVGSIMRSTFTACINLTVTISYTETTVPKNYENGWMTDLAGVIYATA